MRRDEGVIFAWCLLGNHYHLVIRQGPVPLSRTMKSLQEGVTRARNLRDRIYGPLWQGRFKAKEVLDRAGRDRAVWGQGDGVGCRARKIARWGQSLVLAGGGQAHI